MGRRLATILAMVVAISMTSAGQGQKSSADTTQGSVTIVFKDGRRQNIKMSDVARIEFNTPAGQSRSGARLSAPVPGRNHFLGKWKVGDGAGSTFTIELKDDGTAEKSIGATHGTWTVVDGEARISWDDGWKDAIRKVGSKHEKFAYASGKSFSDQPDNVTEARSTTPRPL